MLKCFVHLMLFYSTFIFSNSLFATANEEEEVMIAPQVSLPITFRAKEEISITGYKYSLNDVVECEGYQPLCDEIYAVNLGDSPEPGKYKSLDRKLLLKILEQEWPQHTITLVAPPMIKILSESKEIEESEVKVALEKAIEQSFQGRPELKIRLNNIQIGSRTRTRSQQYAFTFPFLSGLETASLSTLTSKFSGNPSIKVLLQPQEEGFHGHEEFRVVVNFEIEAMIPIAIKSIAKGTSLEPSDFEYKLFQLNRTNNKFETNLNNIENHVLKTSIRAGDPIPLGKLKEEEILSRGQIVQMVMEKNGLRIKSKVKINKAGYKGDIVEAEYLGTKKKIGVKIIDSTLVKYEF